MIKRILATVSLTCLLLATVACGGPLSKLDSTLDYAPFFFQGLVIAGQITQVQADQFKKGITRFEQVADNTKTCLAANEKEDVVCYSELGTEIHLAIVEYYPEANQGKAAEFVNLVQDVVNLIIRKNTPSVGVGGPRNVDADLEKKINELEKLVKSEKG